MEFTITSEQLLGFCGLITAIYGIYKIVVELKKPSEDLKAQVEKHSQLLDQDNRRLRVLEDSQKMNLKCMLAMINHQIDGNGIDKMKEIRGELQEFLVKH